MLRSGSALAERSRAGMILSEPYHHHGDTFHLLRNEMQITQKQFCGHWADADLARALELKTRQSNAARRTLADLETEMLFIQSEQRERHAQTTTTA